MEDPAMYPMGGRGMNRRERYPEDAETIHYYGGNGMSNGNAGRSGGNGSRGGNGGSTASYHEFPYDRMVGGYDRMMPMDMDPRAGRSPKSRKTYMEGKESHHDKTKQMQELEKYMQELSQDMTEMIEDASPEEKTLLVQKLNTLATNKIICLKSMVSTGI
jgi:hypothetical protein